MSENQSKPALSIVIPVYNSAAILPELVCRLHDVLPGICHEFEIILVNDGSRDESWEVIQRIANEYPAVRGFNMMRNYGQHNTLLAGIRHARFPVTITMDDDLQHPPSEIPLLLQKLDEGYDVVYGTPQKQPHSIWRNLTSMITKRALSHVMGIKNIRDISAFSAIRTELRNACASYQSPSLLLDVLLSWGTTKFASVPVIHQARKTGSSNYTFVKLINQTLLIFTGFSTAPLRVASLVGFTFQLFGIIVLFYVIGRYTFEGSLPGFPFLASIISIFSGAQLFALGVIGEYLARIFNRSMERPTYVIKESTGVES